MTRQEVFDWCRQQFGTEEDYPWFDNNAVLRHEDSKKWYGVVLEVNGRKLGLVHSFGQHKYGYIGNLFLNIETHFNFSSFLKTQT